MKQEIKERVEKIRRGEVPEGYRKTKVGIIPDNWDFKKLSLLAKITMGQSPDSSCYNNQEIGIPLIQGNADIKNRITSPKVFTSQITKTCDVGDIIMSVRAPVGEISKSIHRACIGRGVCSIKSLLVGDYLYHYLLFVEKKWIKFAQGSTFEAVNSDVIKRYNICFPLKSEEHQKIAEILSTSNKAIKLKEKLITEKKKLKRGLMQKLLTGEMRFPEFTGNWEKVAIGDMFEDVKRINDNNSKSIDILTISAKHGFLSQKDKFSKVIAGSSLKKYTHLFQNEFAYNKGNSKTAPFGCIFKLDIKEGLVPFVYICFRPTQMIDVDFFDFYFNHGLLDRQLKRIITSGARSDGLLNVSKDDFFNIKIPLPSIEEQKKIGLVLRLIQNEIDYLIAELNQLKEQKRGLMQLLLTGIVRVEVN